MFCRTVLATAKSKQGMQIPGCAEVKVEHPVKEEHPSHPGSVTPKS